jgi:hypothetical protein
MSFLYRKRIKANYRDIDSFLHEALDPVQLSRDLNRVVNSVNFVHECFVASALGPDFLASSVDQQPLAVAAVPRSRLERVRECLG